ALVRRTLARLSASHKFDDTFPVLAATFCAKFVFEDWQHGAVKLLRLGDAHAVHLETDDAQTGLGKDFDHAARPQIWELKIIGLDQDERFFDLRIDGKTDGAIEDAAVGS